MVGMISNANQKVKNLVMTKTVHEHYLSVCENYSKGILHVFNSGMQILITKLGIIIAKVSNGPKISYCEESLKYLCGPVVNDSTLLEFFKYFKVNSNGNYEKHTISENENKSSMEHCVKAYNILVNRIIEKYKLYALKELIVKKISQQAKKQNLGTSNRNMPLKRRSNINSHPQETATTIDEKIRLRAELENGEGRYVKGIFNKTKMVNFRLKVKIDNPNNLKISKVTAILRCGKHQTEKNVSTAEQSVTDFDLPTSQYSGNIEVVVIAIYKIGFMRSKQIKTTVSKNF